jgi:hypothetical protein
MKIIYSDNIPTDMSTERLWMEGVPLEFGKRLCTKLNETLRDDQQGPFYRVVPDDHKLYVWEP